MRAGRLLSTLMLLQSRRRMSAQALAEELEVSVRTVYRDIEHLSAAGVPVTVVRGASGGFELLEGWRTRLTGLTPKEAQAMFLAGTPGAASQLGLGEAMASAQLKLLAALPTGWQADARRVSSRFHLDPVGWYQSPSRVEHLAAIADAVWTERRLKIRYESWRAVVDRVIEPLGLVLKAGEWYVVASTPAPRSRAPPGVRSSTPREPRTYRLSNIHALEPSTGKFVRPRRFDLAKHWAASIARFEAGLYRGTAVVRASSLGLKKLRGLSAAVAEAVERATDERDGDGWLRVRMPIESIDHAVSQLIRMGTDVEVLDPAELRVRLATTARALVAMYDRAPPST
jgi:predicted DNA-binding transcriptional regulator YafY